MSTLLKNERFLLASIVVAVLAFALEHAALEAGRAAALGLTAVLIAAILLVALRVAHHAELLAEQVGEPYGTMILTLSAVAVEVVILAIIMGHSPSPTLARDTIYSAVMLDINGILGIAAIIGGLRHGEQPYNVDTGNTYIVMILTAMGVSMLVPEFVPATHREAYGVFSILAMVGLYLMFLRLQTGRHSYFFAYAYDKAGAAHHAPKGGIALSAALLVLGVALIGVLAETMAKSLDAGLEGLGAPVIVVALLVAMISASPEILTALRAANANRMQPVLNIALGASLATVILTVPVIEALALVTHHPLDMALTPTQTVMMVLTLMAAMINLHDGETNAIEGTTHFVLFAAFLMLSAIGL